MAKLIAVKYATALFELAKENNTLDSIYDEIKTILEAVYESNLNELLNHPKLSSEEKFGVLKNIFENNVSQEIMGLFSVIINKNRQGELVEILEEFIVMAEKEKGIVKARVCSAVQLTEEQISRIENVLSKKLNKQIIISTEVIPELLGGLRIIVEGKEINTTVKYQLEQIKSGLDNIVLA